MKSYLYYGVALLGVLALWAFNPFVATAQETEPVETDQQRRLKALQSKIENLKAEVELLRKQNETPVVGQSTTTVVDNVMTPQPQSVISSSRVPTQTLPTPSIAGPTANHPMVAVDPLPPGAVQQPPYIRPQMVQPHLAQPPLIQAPVAPVYIQPPFVQPFCNHGFSSRAVYIGPGGWGFDVGGIQFNFPRSSAHYHRGYRGHHHRHRERDDD